MASLKRAFDDFAAEDNDVPWQAADVVAVAKSAASPVLIRSASVSSTRRQVTRAFQLAWNTTRALARSTTYAAKVVLDGFPEQILGIGSRKERYLPRPKHIPTTNKRRALDEPFKPRSSARGIYSAATFTASSLVRAKRTRHHKTAHVGDSHMDNDKPTTGTSAAVERQGSSKGSRILSQPLADAGAFWKSHEERFVHALALERENKDLRRSQNSHHFQDPGTNVLGDDDLSSISATEQEDRADRAWNGPYNSIEPRGSSATSPPTTVDWESISPQEKHTHGIGKNTASHHTGFDRKYGSLRHNARAAANMNHVEEQAHELRALSNHIFNRYGAGGEDLDHETNETRRSDVFRFHQTSFTASRTQADIRKPRPLSYPASSLYSLRLPSFEHDVSGDSPVAKLNIDTLSPNEKSSQSRKGDHEDLTGNLHTIAGNGTDVSSQSPQSLGETGDTQARTSAAKSSISRQSTRLQTSHSVDLMSILAETFHAVELENKDSKYDLTDPNSGSWIADMEKRVKEREAELQLREEEERKRLVAAEKEALRLKKLEEERAVRREKERLEREENERQAKEEAERVALIKAKIVLPLTDAWQEKVQDILASDGRHQFPGALTRRDLLTLAPSTWLNDEVINSWMKHVCDTANAERGWTAKAGKPPPYVPYSSHWYSTVCGPKGVSSVARWGRRFKFANGGLLKVDIVLFPINLSNHWTLLVVYPASRRIEYMDSFGSKGRQIVSMARKWLEMELGELYKEDEWSDNTFGESPDQTNGFDCGVFVCFNGMARVRGVDPRLAYSQTDLLRGRVQIVAVLLNDGFVGDFKWKE